MFNRRNTLLILSLFLAVLSACTPRAAAQGAQPPSGGLVTIDKAPFALAARTALSQKLGISLDEVRFVSAESQEWTDSCLGLGGIAESCLQVMTPGYKVTLEAGGQQYEAHTDEAGDVVRIKE
jgi:hypothetical protein